MYSWLSYICLAAVSSLAVGEAVINDCQLVGDADKKSTVEQALLQRLAPLKHKRFVTQTQEGTGTYTYTFVVCGRADNDTGSTVGLMQTRTEPKENTAIGRISQTHIMNGSHWIMMIYRGGDKYDNHCGSEERKATIMILCDKSTLALYRRELQDLLNVGRITLSISFQDDFTIIREERNKTKECFYLFELSSSVACPPEESHLSVGSILLIVFAVLAAVYIIGGFLYQRFMVGAKGIEQFPNILMWQELGNLVADGCDFVCRSRPRSAETAYRGVGDDQLGEEPEERDDHLLPM